MPKKSFASDEAKKALTAARLLRDRALKSIANMLVITKNSTVDPSHTATLGVCARQLNIFEKQFRDQQESIIRALVELNRSDEFETVDSVVADEMEIMVNEINFALSPTNVPTNSLSASAPSVSSHSILPKIELPHFDGNIFNWYSFRDTFDSLVNNNMSISKMEKFHYLLSCLSGQSLIIVKTLPLIASNYDNAWQALIDRYDNQRVLATAHVDKLFAFKTMQQESLSSLSAFLNVFHENIAALKRLNIEDLTGFLLFYMGARALDPDTRLLFEATVPQSQIPNIDMLVDFVRQRCSILENTKGRDNEKGERNRQRPKMNSLPKSMLTTSTGPKKEYKPCPCCPQVHPIYRCKLFKSYRVQKRREIARDENLCYTCLSSSHSASACQSKSSCSTCKRRHHSLLHVDTPAPSATPTRDPATFATQDIQSEFVGLSCSNNTVILGTAVIRVRDQHGAYRNVRVLLDSGSQVSAITLRCVLRLGLKKRKSNVNIIGLAIQPVDEVKGTTSCHFVPRQHDKPAFCCSDIVILSQITAPMPNSSIPSGVRKCYEHLLLADPAFDVPAPIDMLIGGDLFPHMIRPRSDILHNQGLPSALDTFLGWVICGLLEERNMSSVQSLSVTSPPPLSDIIQSFWAVEEVTKPLQPTTEEEQCESWFNQTTSRGIDGRFCVGLPFRDSVSFEQRNFIVKKKQKSIHSSFERLLTNHGLGESYSLALKRLFNLEIRLAKDPPLYAEYRQFMQDYLALGHMKVATQPGKYFIPHHAVVKRDEEHITKLRVVFDASAASSSGLSLNDVLIPGPKLQTEIFDILLKCRVRRFVFTADITKMYRQVLVTPNDCAYQHILWRDTPGDKVVEFELLTVTYGVTSAPYLAIRCLHELDSRVGSHFPAAKNILTQSTYVDDIVIGADSEQELLQVQHDVIALLKSCGCSLKKWTSNCSAILQQVNSEHLSDLVSLDPKGDPSVKVLGLHWEPTSDNFAYHTSPQTGQYTKRRVLSIIARLFDPIGVLGPTLLWAKHFMQTLWQLGLHWDAPLPDHLCAAWDQFVKELPSLAKITLPRHIDVRDGLEIQLVGFSDASQHGYAAIVYLRVLRPLSQISVYFVTCKTKVAPLNSSKGERELSIPRLELCAALLLAQTLNRVQSVLANEISITSICAWTDSTVVLSWLTTYQRNFKVFVTNRIAKIHSLLPDCEWSYVHTTDNPADPASRGLLPNATVHCDLHREGPSFLRLPANQWPCRTFTAISPEKLPDFSANSAAVHLAFKVQVDDDILQRFSSFTRLQRVLVYVKRFISKSRQRATPSGPITYTELQGVIQCVVHLTQRLHFPDLYRQLLNTDATVTPSTLAQLAPFLDPLNLIRVGGRLHYASLDLDAKHPILLPKCSKLTDLIIRHYHQGFLHAGPRLVLSMIRQKFWILSGRDAVRQYIFTCVTCVRHKALRPRPLMGQLPSSRVQPNRVFSQVGLDYGGPFTIKAGRHRNAKTSKVYLSLFVCMTTKAIHLELVTDMSTAAFLAALDRFVARRGIPADLFSDCGTNYVGAARQLKELFCDVQTQNAVANRVPCRWHFNPPAAPHFGGLWEAAIKSTKYHMKHVIGNQIFTYEELHTLVTRIEGILNSRPLTPLSSDPHDLSALTPGHFLIGQPIMALPECNHQQMPTNRLNRWELLQQCQQTFWKRWTQEYLTTLHGRSKWFQSRPNLAVDDLVVVEAPHRPVTDWQLGRIVAVHPGADGVVRTATVRTLDGILKRPVVKLVKLPVANPEETSVTP